MKLEVGMYIRTLTLSGISRIGKLEKIGDICITDNGAVDKNQIIKASNNIIDLIEVGDYVNGKYVYGTGYNTYDDFGVKIEKDLKHSQVIEEHEIKSIVTKEQFESMQYIIGG